MSIVYMDDCTTCVYYAHRPEGGIQSLGSEVLDGCETLDKYLGPLEQSVFFTAEPLL